MDNRLDSTGSHRVFVWATGQDDNIGDSLLRRAYLGRLRQLGALTIWIGSGRQPFLSGLGLNQSDRTVSRYSDWYRTALSASIRGRVVVAVNAGEVPISRAGAARMLSLALLILIAKVRGGFGVWLGAGVPAARKERALAECYRLVRRHCSYSAFRDRESQSLVSATGLMPDWAFELGTPVDEWNPVSTRSTLGIVLRGDRAYPNSAWLAWVSRIATRMDLKITVVVQVQRDLDMAVKIARDLAGSVVEFISDDHFTQEAAVRRTYSDCAIVVGDRLHGLIVAATEGAVPLGWVSSSTGKINRHFDAVGMHWVGRYEGSDPESFDELTFDELRMLRAEMNSAIDAARVALDEVAGELMLLGQVVATR